MLKFMFVLTAWGQFGDLPQVDIADVMLTGKDCIERIEAYNAADPEHSRGVPSCEIDHGEAEIYEIEHGGVVYELPPCPAEDSAQCFWDAAYRGNGQGQTFYNIGGEVFYLF